MPISKDHLVDVLRVRYDAYSAEAVFTQACVRAGLDGTTSFDQRSLASFRLALDQVGDRVGGVLARIDALLEDPSPAAADSKADAKPEWKADAQPEAKTDAQPDPKAESKAESKGDAKPQGKKGAKAESKADAKSESKADAKSESKAETTIVLRGVDVDDGEELFVCGAAPAIGDWDPERATPMVRVDDEWLAMLELPADAEVAFKFLRRDADGEVTWEPGGNRTVRANERLDATWRESS
jgi:hypothetical protein